MASQLAAIAFTLAVLLSFGSRGFAAEPPSPTQQQSVQQAYQQLLATKTFAFGGIGFAGTISEGEKAFHTVAADAKAPELFRALLKNGNAEGRIYGLCGIRKLARPSFDTHARALMDAESTVKTMSGCILSEERSSNVVARIAAGSYDSNIGIAQFR